MAVDTTASPMVEATMVFTPSGSVFAASLQATPVGEPSSLLYGAVAGFSQHAMLEEVEAPTTDFGERTPLTFSSHNITGVLPSTLTALVQQEFSAEMRLACAEADLPAGSTADMTADAVTTTSAADEQADNVADPGSSSPEAPEDELSNTDDLPLPPLPAPLAAHWDNDDTLPPRLFSFAPGSEDTADLALLKGT